MALNQVDVYQPPDKAKTTGGRQGGGKFGTLGGLAAGAALGAAAATGGTSAIAMGAISGAGAGSALGGLLGERVRPGREASTAVERRLQGAGPQLIQSEASHKLKDSLAALREAPVEAKREYARPLLSAYLASLAKDNGGAA